MNREIGLTFLRCAHAAPHSVDSRRVLSNLGTKQGFDRFQLFEEQQVDFDLVLCSGIPRAVQTMSWVVCGHSLPVVGLYSLYVPQEDEMMEPEAILSIDQTLLQRDKWARHRDILEVQAAKAWGTIDRVIDEKRSEGRRVQNVLVIGHCRIGLSLQVLVHCRYFSTKFCLYDSSSVLDLELGNCEGFTLSVDRPPIVLPLIPEKTA